MTLAASSFFTLAPETQNALLRCSQHGAATVGTLLDLAFSAARKSTRGSPLMRTESSRIGPDAARKRIETLTRKGFLSRSTLAHHVNKPPIWILTPNAETGALSFIVPPAGSLHAAITRSHVSAGLASEMGCVTGRDPETLGLWSGLVGRGSYRCRVCHAQRTLGVAPCPASPGSSCQLESVITATDGTTVVAHADVAFSFRSDGSMSRLLVWVDDGRSLVEQWAELAPLARLPADAKLKVVVRPDGLDSAYSASASKWPTMGPRLIKMVELVTKAGLAATRGGSFGHRCVIP